MNDPGPRSSGAMADPAVLPGPGAERGGGAGPAVVFVQEDGLIQWGGREIPLTPQEAQLLGLLIKRQPHMTRTDRLADMMWPAQLPAMPENHVRVVACRIRKKLAGLPVSVVGRMGYGYRLAGAISIAPE